VGPDNKLPLGAWESDRAALQTARLAGLGDAAGLPEDARFRTQVARLIIKREENENAEFDQPAAFVLVSPEEFEDLKASRDIEPLIHTGARRLTGRIHFVQATAIRSIVEEVNGDDVAMFERIAALQLATRPTLIYVPQKPRSTLSYYPNGCESDTGMQTISLGVETVTPEAVEEVINAAHAQHFVTPDESGPYKIWKYPSSGTPVRLAEQGIQQLLRLGLIGRFLHCSIRSEQPGKIGRTDLEVVDDRSGPVGTVIHHAVLELKVLRSRGETGTAVSDKDMLDHMEEGLEQAHGYARDKNSRMGILCCFDMRDQDVGDAQSFSHISSRGAELGVRLRRWYLYRSSNAWRAAIAARKLS
jgi:hypothetical protein